MSVSVILKYNFVILVMSSFFNEGFEQFCNKPKEDCNNVKNFLSSSLVIYDEKKIPSIYKNERELKFNGEVIKIKQKWSEIGVAGSVWDSVMTLSTKEKF